MESERKIRNKTIRYKSRLYILVGFFFILMGLIIYSGKVIYNEYLDRKDNQKVEEFLDIQDDRDVDEIYFDTIRDSLAFPLEGLQYTKNEINNTINKVSKKFGIETILNNSFNEITLSEKTKVIIATALIHKPRIILLDNTISMLSTSDKKLVMKILREYQKEYNLTIILMTTNLEETLEADKIVVLNKGQIAIEGPPKEIYKDDYLEKLNFNLPFIVKLSENLILYNLLDKIYLQDKEVIDKLWP